MTQLGTDRTPANARRAIARMAGLAGALVILAACGSSEGGDSAASGVSIPTQDVVSVVQVNDAARALLPDVDRKNSTVSIAIDTVEGTARLPLAGLNSEGNEVGLSKDIRDAVGKALGLTWDVQEGTFATIIPGVQSGRYQLGMSNFGVTKDRIKVVDFATYLKDGQSFVGSAQAPVTSVREISDVCGLKIATGSGTTFQKILDNGKTQCAAKGKPVYEVQYFADNAPIFTGLQKGTIDAYFGPTLALTVLPTRLTGTRYLGEISKTPVGIVTPKGSAFAPAIQSAINGLISNGQYAAIFKKWGVPDSAVPRSEINPDPGF
ncbi:transporter substrate-binding domain-containing protein [Gordonia sp. CPCC 205333]|uniref:transporter substrate-binding domain-containing protein n=1 Tax=Gordonia sp. CPCC 205333 TaxID=3140790 RepID=UPI003AF3CB8F